MRRQEDSRAAADSWRDQHVLAHNASSAPTPSPSTSPAAANLSSVDLLHNPKYPRLDTHHTQMLSQQLGSTATKPTQHCLGAQAHTMKSCHLQPLLCHELPVQSRTPHRNPSPVFVQPAVAAD